MSKSGVRATGFREIDLGTPGSQLLSVPVAALLDEVAGEFDPRGELQGVIDRLFANRKSITALDAGCGSGIHIRLSRDAHIVGIDISESQLERNRTLNQRILGDIQSHNFSDESFDLIMCWDVLEHLPEPEKALRSFAGAVKADGAILLALPNVYSLKGLITKFTPHWFHIWVYRHIFKSKNAGKPGYSPFPTYLRPSISVGALKRFAAENKLVVEYLLLYEGPTVKKLESTSPILCAVYKLLLSLLKSVSLGTYDGSKSDFFVIFRRQATGKSPTSG